MSEELVPKLEEIVVEPEKLFLDPNNPRLIAKREDQRDENAAVTLAAETQKRMEENDGVLPVHPLFAHVARRSSQTCPDRYFNKFDPKTKQITNDKLANARLSIKPRQGWEEFYKMV